MIPCPTSVAMLRSLLVGCQDSQNNVIYTLHDVNYIVHYVMYELLLRLHEGVCA